jgi:hypothetical protein
MYSILYIQIRYVLFLWTGEENNRKECILKRSVYSIKSPHLLINRCQRETSCVRACVRVRVCVRACVCVLTSTVSKGVVSGTTEFRHEGEVMSYRKIAHKLNILSRLYGFKS